MRISTIVDFFCANILPVYIWLLLKIDNLRFVPAVLHVQLDFALQGAGIDEVYTQVWLFLYVVLCAAVHQLTPAFMRSLTAASVTLMMIITVFNVKISDIEIRRMLRLSARKLIL